MTIVISMELIDLLFSIKFSITPLYNFIVSSAFNSNADYSIAIHKLILLFIIL